jgi:predicted transcriptional regulator of viral defense system
MSALELEDRPYTLKELADLGYNRMRLSRLVRDGLLQNDARGVYRLPYDGENSERAAWAARSVKYPGSVFCLYSAAVYHGITENMGAKVWLGVGGRLRSTSEVEYFTWKEPENFTIGIQVLDIGGAAVRITDPLRTLIDFFRYSGMGRQDGRMTKKPVDPEALNDVVFKYMRKFGPPGLKGLKMARTFGVQKEMQDYMNILTGARPDLWLPSDHQED